MPRDNPFMVTWELAGIHQDLRGVHVVDSRIGWAVGTGGTIVALRDGGASWEVQKSGTDKDLRAVHFADARTGWAVGTGGTIVATRDAGATWKAQQSDTGETLNQVHFSDATNGWVVGGNGTVLATQDGGASWRQIFEKQPDLTYANISDAYLADVRTGWVVGAGGMILATDDGGKNWRSQNYGSHGARFADAQTGWVVGPGGTILATQDGGRNWIPQESGTEKDLRATSVANAQTAWAVGEAGTILATRNGGRNWEAQVSGTEADLNFVHFADARLGWAVGANGTILVTHDGGVSWAVQKSGTNEALGSVHFAGPQTGWVVGAKGTILATRDGGTSWLPQVSRTDIDPEGTYFIDASNGWVVGVNGTILATRDGGATWQGQKSDTDKTLFSVHFVDARVGWAVGDAGIIVATQDGGESWQKQTSGTSAFLTDAHFVDLHKGWAVGADGTILATEDGGASWNLQRLDADLEGIQFVNARTGWAVGASGTILATSDGGRHWHRQRSGTNKDIRAVSFTDVRSGWVVAKGGNILVTRDGGVSWEAQKRDSDQDPSGQAQKRDTDQNLFGKAKTDTDQDLLGVHFADARIGWAVGVKGTILATRDGGESWEQPIGDDLWSGFFIDKHAGWVVGKKGTILATSDGGASWRKQTTGTDHEIGKVQFSDVRTGWAVASKGTILATSDGGKSWKPQPSGTDQDLRSEYFVNTLSGWVVGDKGTILATSDGGKSWMSQRSGIDQFLEDVYFVDERTGWAVGYGGVILSTHDGGARWVAQKSGTKMHLGRVHFVDAQIGWAIAHEGILATRDGGTNWVLQRTGTKEGLWNIHFANKWTGWVVGEKGTILATRDGGTNWMAQENAARKDLRGVRFAGANIGWAVGDNGTLLHASPPVYAPWVDVDSINAQVSAGGLTGELDVSFAVHADSTEANEIKNISLLGRIGRADWTTLGAATPVDGISGRWHVSWPVDKIGVHPGDAVAYAVRFDDGGPPLPPVELRAFTYDPWWAQLWRQHHDGVIGALGASIVLLTYAGTFALLLLVAPARLAGVGGASKLDGLGSDALPMPSGILGFVLGLGRRIFTLVTLPYICRHPRVRRAWTDRYRQGKASLRELGKPARESFVTEPEVLDAWVEGRTRKVIAALDRLELFKQRRVYVAVPLRVDERQDGPIIERPSPDTLKEYFAPQRAVIAVVGAGGSGKSTLACALARWAIADDPKERLAKHRMLPVFIVEDTTDLLKSVTRNLRRMLGDEELPDDLVRGLLAKQRILVIVDALSERDAASQRHIEQVFAEDASPNAIVITSRTEPVLGAVNRTTLYPVRLDAARVVPFIIGYVNRLEHVENLKDGRVQLRLGERILALAEAGGHQTAVTPLLVTLFVDSAVARAGERKAFDDMPEAVPEVFVDYLRRLNSGGVQTTGAVPDDVFIHAAQILAGVSLGSKLVPQDFLPQDALEALAGNGKTGQDQPFLDRLVASGLIERRTPGGIPMLRFSLDPAAEYLAAIRKTFELKAVGRDGWSTYLDELSRREGYPDFFDGYLTALAACYRAYRTDFLLPDIRFPWETR